MAFPKGKENWFVKIPMVIMFIITLSALGVMVVHDIKSGNYVLAAIAGVLFLLAVFLVFESFLRIRDFQRKTL
jgi:carbon starvation protein